MFAIHQRTRRRICQAGFCLLCAMPTSGLLAWTIALKTPQHAAQCRRDLTDLLGMQVRFQQVRYPQPGESLYEGFELVDAETSQWVLRCRELYVTRAARKLALAPGEIELAAERGGKLFRLLMRRLTHELAGEEAIWLAPSSVTLERANGGQTYEDVACRVESNEDKSTATLRFRLPEAESGEPPMLSITRRHTGDGTATTLSFDTLGAVLPVSVFSPWIDLRSVLGEDAEFSGSLVLEEAGGRWSGELKGALTDVELENLVTRRFPHHFVGRARVEIDRARIDGGKLTEAAGRIRCEAGTIGSSLLVAATELLDCQPGPSSVASGANSVFHELALAFELDHQGLYLGAAAGGEVPGAIMLNDRDQAMLLESRSARLPLVQLVKALVPDSMVQVPATKETAALVPWLPLPPVVRSPDDRGLSAPPLRMNGE